MAPNSITSGNIIARIYPVGAIYISTLSTNPATLFGFGTWEAFGSGRTIVGLDSGQTEFDTVEETGGAKTHTLTEAEMPSHTHSLTRNNSPSGANANASFNANVTGAVTSTTNTTTNATGSGSAHNNLQPYIVVYMFKRTA